MRAALALAAVLGLMGEAPPAASQTEESATPVPGPMTSPGITQAAAPCTIEGDDGDNHLVGTVGPDVICGMGGNDLLEGIDGDDVLDGGDGTDTATYESTPCCVRADLATGTATGAGTDQLLAVEGLTGSQGDDVLRGSFSTDTLSGLGGTDLLYGGDGDDILLGGEGNDYLDGGSGLGVVDGGEGADVCTAGFGGSCYPPSPLDGDDTPGILDVRQVVTAFDISPPSWRIAARSRASARRLWDTGFTVVSFDTRDDAGFEFHALVKSNGKRVRGLLFREGHRHASGSLKASRPSARSVVVRVPLERLEIPLERAYYRWTVRTIFTGPRCAHVCFDVVPSDGEGALPQPIV